MHHGSGRDKRALGVCLIAAKNINPLKPPIKMKNYYPEQNCQYAGKEVSSTKKKHNVLAHRMPTDL
jgi:hypothetical protein